MTPGDFIVKVCHLQERPCRSKAWFTDLGVFGVVSQTRFTRFPARTFDEGRQFVADELVRFGLVPQIRIVVQLQGREKGKKPNVNSQSNATWN